MKITRTNSEEVVVLSVTVTRQGIVIASRDEAVSHEEARKFAEHLIKVANQVELNSAYAQIVDFDEDLF